MRIVSATGPTEQPLLAIVGEAPGEHEEREGKPFVGASGFLLNQMLTEAGIIRDECFITNVSNVRPPKNDFGKMFYEDEKRRIPTPALIEMRQRVWSEIKLVRPKLVVCLGNEAWRAFGLPGSVGTYRGTVTEHFGFRFLPTYHPAYILRVYGDRPVVEIDLKKAIRQARDPYVPPTSFTINPSFDECLRFLKSRDHKRLALDIETLGVHTRCIGFAWNKYQAICIPLISGGESHWTYGEELEILTALNELLLDPSIEFILQNGPFDQTILAKEFGFSVSNVALDTMFGHHLLFPELLKGLDFLCSLYTDHPMYWGYSSSNDMSTWRYNCYDCIVTFEAAEEEESQLKDRNLLKFYHEIIAPTVKTLTRVQSRGVLIDVAARQAIALKTKSDMDAAEIKIHTLLNFDLNPSSPKQVKELVYERWGLPKQRKPREDTKTTVDEDALKQLIRKCSDPLKKEVLESIITYRQKRTLLGTFTDMALDRGRVRTSYNPAGTVTGRISSSTTYDGFGGNLQNIPRGEFRRIFISDPGKVLIKADLSQAEYRVLIWKARIRRIIDRFLSDPKFSVHMWNAAENIYRVPYAQVTKKMYDDAKNGVYGSNYGIGHIKVSRMYNIELRDAKFIIDRYHEAVKEIKDVYQSEIREAVQTTRIITNPFGRERIFFGRMDDELFRSAYSHFCQSTVADVINIGLCRLDNLVEDWLELLLQVHDEIVSQVPLERLSEGVNLVRNAMTVPITFDGVPEPLVIPVEIKVGYNWYDMKPLEEFTRELQGADLSTTVC